MKIKIKLTPINSFIYNAADHPDFMRGTKIINGKLIKNACQLIYSVYCIDEGVACCQSMDCWGKVYEERIPVEHLIPYKKNETHNRIFGKDSC